MIIEKVRARGFGLFETLELTLPEHLCVVHGANESGKSTLAEVIFAALYGAQEANGSRLRARPEVSRLKPWAGGDFTVAVDVVLASGQRLAIVRRLASRKDDLRVTDLATGQDLQPNGERAAVALELLAGISAQMFRASVLISDLPTGAIDTQALHERASNLTSSGDETVSVKRAVELIETQLGEVGKTDQARQTKIGQAIASRQRLEDEIRVLTERRQSTLVDQAAQQAAEQAALAQTEALAQARRQQAAIRRWTAQRRIAELAESSAQIERLEQEIKPLAALAQVDPQAARGLKEAITAAQTSAHQEMERAEALRAQAAAASPAPTIAADWVDRAWQELNKSQPVQSQKVTWWPWLASGVLVVAAAALFATGQPAAGGVALVAAIAACVLALRLKPAAHGDSSRRSALAQEAGESVLSLELVRRVEAAWASWRQQQLAQQEWAEEADRLEASAQTRLEQANRTEADLARLMAGLGEGTDLGELAAKRNRLGELQQQLVAARQAHNRLLDLPESTLVAWQDGADTAEAGDLAAQDREVQRLEAALQASQVTSQALAQALRRRLGEPTELPELEAAFRRADALVGRRQHERQALALAQLVLSEVGAEFHRQMGPELAARMGRWLERLSGGRYNQATLQDSGDPRISGPGEIALRAPEELSQGTQDLAYLSLRLALCELVFADETVPLIVDEPAAHLDPERHARLVTALAEISAHRQVVVLTCHPWERDALAAAGASVLEPAQDARVKIRH